MAAGIDERRVCLDPGIGFGKTVEQNFELVARLDVLLKLGRPVLVGFSRKSSLGRVLGDRGRAHGPALRVDRGRGRGVRARRDDPPRARREGARRSAHRRERHRVIVEIHGLEIVGRHGVGEAERRDGQPFLFDVTLEVAEPAEDEIGATVDYRAVRDTVRELSDARSYRLLESLAGAAADAIVAAFPVESVTVRVRKPGVAWADWTAATASRARPS